MAEQNESGRYQRYQALKTAARERSSQAVHDVVRDIGGHPVHDVWEQALPGPDPGKEQPEPIALLEAAHELAQALLPLTGDYIRAAREVGRAWVEIGNALDLVPYAAANKISVGEEAHDFAMRCTGDHRATSFSWTCPSCRQKIADHGPYPDPPRREDGHDATCARRAAEMARWEARRSQTSRETAPSSNGD